MAEPVAARLTLLGGWQLEVAGTPLPVPPGGQRLIALLALRGPMPRARAAVVLFPDRLTLAAASARLRDLLSRCLRQCPALAGVLRTGQELALAQTVSVDRWDLGEAGAALLSGDVTALDMIGEMPAGLDLLPGWDEDWVDGERDLLRRTFSRALCRCSVERLRAGDVDGALIAAERAGRLDPLDEAAVRCRIRAHLRAGDAALAVRIVDNLRQVLRRELGVDPEPATEELISAAGRARSLGVRV